MIAVAPDRYVPAKSLQPSRPCGRSLTRVRSLILFLLLLTASTAGAQDPDVVIDEAISRWHIGGGFFVWTLDCDADRPGYLKRQAILSNASLELEVTPKACSGGQAFWGLQTDVSGLYYYSPAGRQIVRRPHHRPDLIENVVSLSNNNAPRFPVRLALSDEHIFWLSRGHLMRVPKTGGSAQVVAPAAEGTSLAIEDDRVFWLDRQGLHTLAATCPDSGNCQARRLVEDSGESLWLGDTHAYWISNNRSKQRIQRLDIRPLNISASRAETLYEARTASWRLSQPIEGGGDLFWKEHVLGNGSTARVMRRSLGTQDPAEQLASNLNSVGRKMGRDQTGIYFTGDGGRLFRLPMAAAVVNHDLRAIALEVTQGIQNWRNDSHLSAEKTTFVRFFGTMPEGPTAHAVEAELRGSRDGQPLPGSPLRSLNGPKILLENEPINRTSASEGWLFQLPETWISGGRVRLEGHIDPNRHYPDPRQVDNRVVANVLFKDQPPSCVVMVPVRGHGPRARNDSAGFRAARSRARRLLPSPRLQTFTHSSQLEELEVCWWGILPYPCFGPYEMSADPDKVIFALALRDAHSDDPDTCEDQGALVQYMGMVHDQVFTGPTAGKGNFCRPWSWIKLPVADPTPQNPRWGWPREGATFAHELAHNFERYHVNCGGPGDVDGNYPYPPCKIDCQAGDTGCPANLSNNPGLVHFGFDVDTQTPISPAQAGDLMSYSHSAQPSRPRWISDYTWREVAIKQRTEGPELFSCVADFILSQTASQRGLGNQPTVPDKPATARPSLAQARRALLVSGVLAAEPGESRIQHAWQREVADLSPGMLRKWQRQTTGHLSQSHKALMEWHLRLRDADGKWLGEYLVAPLGSDQGKPTPGKERYFLMAIPLPEVPVARLELLTRNQQVASLAPGAAAPRLKITQPRGGERFDGPVTIGWHGIDADKGDILLYTVQYSADGGKHWQALATDMPGRPDTPRVELQVDTLPGSQLTSGSLIRILASDGLHTSTAISRPFTVNNQPPSAYIDWPQPGDTVSAGRPIILRGGADDLEGGALDAKGLAWSLDGEGMGSGSSVTVDGLGPGRYEVELLARDTRGDSDRVVVPLRVAPLVVLAASKPQLDGRCDDAAYRWAPLIRLAPYAGGSQASVRLLHHGDDLYLCFSGLQRTPRIAGRPSLSRVGLRIDGDHDAGPQLSRGDHGFYMREDGVPLTRSRDDRGRLSAPGPGNFQGLISRQARHWQAELRIDASDLIRSDRTINILLSHENAGAGARNMHLWPYRAGIRSPASWAQARLGSKRPLPIGLRPAAVNASPEGKPHRASERIALLPATSVRRLPDTPLELHEVLPKAVAAGSAEMTLRLRGKGFGRQSRVLWNGVERPTRFVSPQRLEVSLSAADLELGRTVGITVDTGRAIDSDALPAPLFFEIRTQEAP